MSAAIIGVLFMPAEPPMSAIVSQIDPRSPDFLASSTQLRGMVDDLQRELIRSAEGGGAKAREKHTARGKLLPRERIRALLDPGSPFLELSALAAHGMYDDAAPAAGLITGIGRVNGIEVVWWPTTPRSRAAPTFR